MTRFQSPCQVVLLFAGAAVVSVVLVALLTVEAENRKIKEPEIENGNLLEALGRQVVRWTRRWRHHHRNDTVTDRRARRSVDQQDRPAVRHHHRRLHAGCYSTNEVLLVIAVTCAVNFAFVTLVMALVHLCGGGKASSSGGDDDDLLDHHHHVTSLRSFSMENLLSAA